MEVTGRKRKANKEDLHNYIRQQMLGYKVPK
jgi:hypothetical protein